MRPASGSSGVRSVTSTTGPEPVGLGLVTSTIDHGASYQPVGGRSNAAIGEQRSVVAIPVMRAGGGAGMLGG
jgi:hypothetical protein